jgi:hypothetical protein
MDLRKAMDLVIADTRAVTDPAMTEEEALDCARAEPVQDVLLPGMPANTATAYKTVAAASSGDIDAALADRAEFGRFTGHLAETADVAERVDAVQAAVQACGAAVHELDQANTAADEQQHAAELARRPADEHTDQHDHGHDLGQD